MQYRITNRTGGTLLLRLRSGRTIHLAARASADGLDGSEINGNPRITSLVERRMAVVEGAEQAAGQGGGGRGKRAAREPSRQGEKQAAAGKATTGTSTRPAEKTTRPTESTGGSR